MSFDGLFGSNAVKMFNKPYAEDNVSVLADKFNTS